MLNDTHFHEGSDDVISCEVKNEAEGDADWQGGQGLLPEGQEDERGAQPDQNGDHAGQGHVPVPRRRRLTHQHAKFTTQHLLQ